MVCVDGDVKRAIVVRDLLHIRLLERDAPAQTGAEVDLSRAQCSALRKILDW
jgi:hypothetical protein